MTINKTHEFEEGTRYVYDNFLLDRGFAQIDTGSDASYFGNWASPSERIMFTFAEGDCYTTTATTDEEFVQLIKECVEWHNEYGDGFKGIDPGLSEERKQEWIDIGLQEYLH